MKRQRHERGVNELGDVAFGEEPVVGGLADVLKVAEVDDVVVFAAEVHVGDVEAGDAPPRRSS